MTDDWVGHNPSAGTGWFNTEYRTFEFVPLQEQATSRYSIREIEWSVLRREAEGLHGKPLGESEKREFSETVVNDGGN